MSQNYARRLVVKKMKRMTLLKLALSGEGKEDAVLLFEKGLNVITGDSDTGKTYAFQCLNYILGAEKLPKPIVEARGYTTISLEFEIDNDLYKIERSLSNANASIFHKDKIIMMPCKHDPANTNNLSRYILQLLQEHDSNAFLKKNNKNEKRTLSFRDLVHLITVGETDIIAESSAFQSIQYTEKTVRKSVLKYIITGDDDEAISKVDDSAEENIRRTGVVLFLKKRKEILKDKIAAIENDKNYQLYVGAESVRLMLEQIETLRDEISQFDVEFTENQSNIQRIEKLCFADEVKLEEFNNLKDHYIDEYRKIDMASVYSDFLVQLPRLNCPICKQTFKNELMNSDDTEKLFRYFHNQSEQLKQKINDLNSSIIDITDRLNKNKNTLNDLSNRNMLLSEFIVQRERTLMGLNKNISAIRLLDSMKKALEIYKQELSSVNYDITFYSEKVKVSKKPSDSQNSALYEEYCLAIEKVLKNWGFSNETKVTFDTDTLDLFIDGKARSDWGKGYRAFVMSAMVIGLMRYCSENNKLHPGFVILDSPLVSLKERKKDPIGNWVEDYMERKMIEDILKQDGSRQVIIFENKDIKYGYQYNYIEFTHDGDGRKGFIPIINSDAKNDS